MLKDITIGQYVPTGSVLHKMDPRFKIVLVFAMMVLVFFVKNFAGMGLLAVFVVGACILSKIPASILVRSFRPLLPFILITVILNLFYSGGETVLVQFWIITITLEGILYALLMILRIVFMLLIGSLLTFTTSPVMLTDALERLMKPLSYIKVPVQDIAMMMTIALRYIPNLIDETNKIMNAQKARGANLDTGKFTQRVKALIPVLVPLFVSAFKRAEELALAMECRCYNSGARRTRLKQMKSGAADFAAVGLMLLLIGGIVAANALLPAVVR